jgi:hypothetical protein
MIDAWQPSCVRLGDALLGWALALPRDATVILLGLLLALVLSAVRRATTNPVRLRQIASDERRLRDLIRDARAAGDHEAIARRLRVRRLLAGQRAGAEWIAVCASCIVLCAMAPWCWRRLEYLPLGADEPVQFVARFPSAALGEVVHLVPRQGMSSVGGWVRKVAADHESGAPQGKAEWTLRMTADAKPGPITVRMRHQSVEHALLVGGSTYEPPLQRHDGDVETEVMLVPYRPLGLLPRRVASALPGWSLLLTAVTTVGYFALRGGRRTSRRQRANSR